MKTLIFMTGLFFILSSFAGNALEPMEIQDFSGSYQSDRGNAQALVWHLPSSQREENMSFEVFKENQQFRLVTPQQEYIFDQVPEVLFDLENLSWLGANASTEAQNIRLSLTSLQGDGLGMSLDLNRLDGNCNGGNLSGDFFDDLVSACSNQGTLTFQSLVYTSAPTRGGYDLYHFFRNILSNQKGGGSSVTLRNFDLLVRNKSFDLKVKADLDVSATVKAEGSFDYNPQRIRIRIDKVKASFLNITNKVFNELEKIQSQNVVVSRPYVTITLP